MTKAQHLKRCKRLVAKWQKVLLLQHWSIDVVYVDKETDVYGSTFYVADSLRATITFYRHTDLHEFDETACHEVMHIVLVDMQEAEGKKTFNGLLEKTVEHLTHVIRSLA